MNRLAEITHCCLVLRRACLCRMLVGKQGESEDQDAEPRYPSTSVSSSRRNRTFRPGVLRECEGRRESQRALKNTEKISFVKWRK